MTTKEQAKAAIYTRLSSVPPVRPSSANLFHDFTMQSGDIVRMKAGTDTYYTPVYGMKMHWNGTSSVRIGNSGARHRPTLEKMAQKKSTSPKGAYRAERKRQTRLEWIVGIDDYGEFFVDHPGKIALAINEQTGETLVNIDADKIRIGSDGTNDIVLGDMIGISLGYLWVKGDLHVASKPLDPGHGRVFATEVHISADGSGSLVFEGSSGNPSATITRANALSLTNLTQTHVKVYGPDSNGVYTIYYLPAAPSSYVTNPTPSNHNGWLTAGTITVPTE